MSCRLIPPGDPRTAAPVDWPSVCPPPPLNGAPHSSRDGVPPAPAPDPALDAALREQAFEEKLRAARAVAHREGEAAGRSRASAELQPVLERLSSTVADLASLRPRLRREAEADMLQLALAIARRVLRRELAIDPEALHGLVLAALEKLALQDIARVRVHPSQAALVSTILRQSGGASTVEVAPDPALASGDAIFETSRGSLDASIETQLQEIERGLADCLRRQP
jgi:flagellar assembly protein FliH